MSRDKTLAEVIHFIAEETSIRPQKILISSRLYQDLGIYGDDADSLMRSFAKRFGVDMGGFDFHTYFFDEPSLLDWLRMFRSMARRIAGMPAKANPKPITVGDLVQAADERKWIAPRA